MVHGTNILSLPSSSVNGTLTLRQLRITMALSDVLRQKRRKTLEGKAGSLLSSSNARYFENGTADGDLSHACIIPSTVACIHEKLHPCI